MAVIVLTNGSNRGRILDYTFDRVAEFARRTLLTSH
jgi:hypothetical protein